MSVSEGVEEVGAGPVDVASPAPFQFQIKPAVLEYIEVCNLIDDANKDLKKLKDNKKHLEALIDEYMRKNNVGECNTETETVTYRESKSKKPLNKQFISETICTRITDNAVSEELLRAVFEQRPVTTTQKLCIVRKK